MLYKFALQNDICSKDYAQYVDISQYKDKNPNKYDRQPFSKEEIETVWKMGISEHRPHDTRHTNAIDMI